MQIQNSSSKYCRRLLGSLAGHVRAAGSDQRGVAAAEFGILVPLLSLMIVSITDIGLALYRKMQVEHAAQVGVQYAISRGFDENGISSAVASATNATDITASPPPVKFCGCPTGAGVSAATCGAACIGGTTAGTYATVSARATYYTIIDYQIVAATYSYTAQSTARLQ